MIRCLVVDDEPLALGILTDYIEKVPFLELISATTNAFDALAIAERDEADLIFLDVQMPQLTGIQFLNIINRKCSIILTTAYPQYALDGYELNIADYLLKPIAFDRFYKSVLKVQNAISQSKPETVVADSSFNNFIFVKTEHRIQKIYIDEILYIEGLKDYISIFTKTERVITLQPMKKMETSLPKSRFIRVHKSYIVSIDKIDSIEKSRILIADKIIPVGDTYKEEFFKIVDNKI